MNISRNLLRIWLTITSLIGFVAGWIFLSHTVESETATQVGNTSVDMPELQAIPTLNTQSSGSNNVQTFSVNPNSQQQSFSPGFRTGGS
jgi:hypothetical protein